MIGLDISDRSIKVAEVSEGQQREVMTVCWSSLPAGTIVRGLIRDVPAVANGVREAFTRCSPVSVKGRAVVASIPENRSFVRVLDLPQMSEPETEEAIQWAVRQHIPFDLDKVYIDWQTVPFSTDSNRQSVLIGVAQRDIVDPLVEVLEQAELEVIALELEAQAIVRALLPLTASDVRGVLIVDLGSVGTNVIYFSDGVMRYTSGVQVGGDDLTARIAQTLHIQPSIAAEQKAAVGVGGVNNNDEIAMALREATLDLVQRVEKVVREMGTQLRLENYVKTILLAGGAANLPGIQNVFGEVFPGVPVQMGNPWTNIVLGSRNRAPLTQQDASHFATALGLALRSKEDA